IQVIQAVLKDARMREQAHLIQGEVVRLMEDISRLADRVRKLQTHFMQANQDIDLILTSTDKVTKRGARSEALELGALEGKALPDGETAEDGPPAGIRGSSSLRLRVVEE